MTKHFAVAMHCPSCAMVLEGLEDRAGIEHVHAEYKTGRVDVTYDETVITGESVLQAIRDEGYEAHEA